MAVNVTGTTRVAEAARSAGAERWVYSASASATAARTTNPTTRDRTPHRPLALRRQQFASEQIVRSWSASMASTA